MRFQPLPYSRSTFLHPMPVSLGYSPERVRELLERHWKLNRTAVNADTDILARYLAAATGGCLVEAASGSECLTWIIPNRWTVRSAQLRRLTGEVICDFSDNPLHLWTHSVGFKGAVSREDLFAHHLQTDPARPDEFIYHFCNGYRHNVREWGFSLPWRVAETLTDEAYEVDIDADLDNDGTLKVVDTVLPGELPDTIFIMAHTCHPALISDGIGCIAIANELFHHLAALPKRRYTYRFLYGPEYFAAAAWLSKAEPEAVKSLRFGIYLDMLTSHEPIGFQISLQGNSRMDHVARNVLASHSSQLIERPYRRLWGNDEMFYNGPGFDIPTIGLGRLMHREYHYNTDDLQHLDTYHLRESLWMLRRIVEVFETDYLPERRYRGPIYLSRYGLSPRFSPAPDNPELINHLQALMDGERSCMDIASRLGLDFFQVRDFCDSLAECGLIERGSRPPRPWDCGTIV